MRKFAKLTLFRRRFDEPALFLLDDIDADDSYRLTLVGKHNNKIEWTTGEGSDMKTWHRDPETTTASRLLLDVLSPFAPEELL